MHYHIIEASRRPSQERGSLFTEDYNGRLKPEFNQPSSDPRDHLHGFSSHALTNDANRQVILLPNEASIQQYESRLAKLEGTYYTQGDLMAQSDLVGISTVITQENFGNDFDSSVPTPHLGDEANPTPRQQKFSYLRKDGLIGGVAINYDPFSDQIYLATVLYPHSATSYLDAMVCFFLPENLAEKALTTETLAHYNQSESEERMLNTLQSHINNTEIFSLIQTIFHNKSLFKRPENAQSGQLGLDRPLKYVICTDIDAQPNTEIACAITTPIDAQQEAACLMIKYTAQAYLQTLKPEDLDQKDILDDLIKLIDMETLTYTEKNIAAMQHILGHQEVLRQRPFSPWDLVEEKVNCLQGAKNIMQNSSLSTSEKIVALENHTIYFHDMISGQYDLNNELQAYKETLYRQRTLEFGVQYRNEIDSDHLSNTAASKTLDQGDTDSEHSSDIDSQNSPS